MKPHAIPIADRDAILPAVDTAVRCLLAAWPPVAHAEIRVTSKARLALADARRARKVVPFSDENHIFGLPILDATLTGGTDYPEHVVVKMAAQPPTRGVLLAATRFLAGPANTPEEEAMALLPVVLDPLEPQQVPGMVYQLAAHPSAAVRAQLARVLRHHASFYTVDPRDMRAIEARLGIDKEPR